MAVYKSQNEEGFSFFDIIIRYIRYWRWFLVSVLFFVTVSALYSFTKEKVYKVSLLALLNQEMQSSSTDVDYQLEALGISSTVSNLDNEIIMLSSPDLMALAVDALHLDVDYSVKNTFGRHTYLYSESPYKVYFTPISNSNLGVRLSIHKNNLFYVIEGRTYGGKEVAFREELKELPATIPLLDNLGTISVGLSGQDISSEVYYVHIRPVASVAYELASKLRVTPVLKASSVLEIDLQINNTAKGAALLEELIRQYNESAVDEKKQKAYNTSLFINERLKEISNELGAVENEVVEYKQRNRFMDIESETSLYMQQTGEYEKQRVEMETQLRVIRMVEDFVSNNKETMIPSLGVNDPNLSKVIEEYNTNVTAYERLLKSTSENNPSRIRLQKELETARYGILNSIQNERQSMRIALSNINVHGSSVSSRIESMPQQERGLLEKERQQQVIESLFLFLMQKREETNVAMASTSEKAKIVISPSGGTLTSPKIKVDVFTFFILGLIIPLFVIFIKECFRKTFNEFSEFKRSSNLKLIGGLSHNEDEDAIIMSINANSRSSELFRILRNNIDYHFEHQHNKLILVTSSIEGEGKSFVGLNLAIAFALIGKRVLLVDVDMRNENLDQYLQSRSDSGLTKFLSKETTQWEDAIEYISSSYPNLHILKTGTVAPNPNELLMSDTFGLFVKTVKDKYDYVIMDSSPIENSSDAFIITEYADITLYVVREDYTPKQTVFALNKENISRRLNNLHVVYNDTTSLNTVLQNIYCIEK